MQSEEATGFAHYCGLLRPLISSPEWRGAYCDCVAHWKSNSIIKDIVGLIYVGLPYDLSHGVVALGAGTNGQYLIVKFQWIARYCPLANSHEDFHLNHSDSLAHAANEVLATREAHKLDSNRAPSVVGDLYTGNKLMASFCQTYIGWPPTIGLSTPPTGIPPAEWAQFEKLNLSRFIMVRSRILTGLLRLARSNTINSK